MGVLLYFESPPSKITLLICMDIQLMFLQIRWHMQMIEHNHFIYPFLL